MAEYTGYFDATAGSPSYDSAEYSRFSDMISTNIASGYENELEVTAGTGLQVIVDSGGMTSKGRYYIQDEDASGGTPYELSIDAATTGYLRKDRIVVEFDVTNKTVSTKVSKGTEATSSPVAQALVDTATVWEIGLAIVNVSASTLSSVEDDRTIGGRENYMPLTGGTLTGDIIMPNATVQDSGKLYLNTGQTAYLRYTSNALYLKLPSCDEVQVAMVTVGTSATPPTPTDAYPINTMYLERDA